MWHFALLSHTLSNLFISLQSALLEVCGLAVGKLVEYSNQNEILKLNPFVCLQALLLVQLLLLLLLLMLLRIDVIYSK